MPNLRLLGRDTVQQSLFLSIEETTEVIRALRAPIEAQLEVAFQEPNEWLHPHTLRHFKGGPSQSNWLIRIRAPL